MIAAISPQTTAQEGEAKDPPTMEPTQEPKVERMRDPPPNLLRKLKEYDEGNESVFQEDSKVKFQPQPAPSDFLTVNPRQPRTV